MLASSIPAKFSIPWGASAGVGYIRTIPTASQIGITAGAASLTDGFPPVTFLPVGGGGTPPFGQDFNGILNQLTATEQWYMAGGPIKYDSTFSTAIGGYPNGALIASATTAGLYWLSTADNNTSNPDASGANWSAISLSNLAFARTRIQANTTYYVTTSGNDTTGTGTVGNPFATPQGAWNYLFNNVDLNSYIVTISIGAGTFANVTCSGKLTGQRDIGTSPIIFSGAGAGSTTLTSSTNTAYVIFGATAQFSNMTLISTGASASAMTGQYGGIAEIGSGLSFGATTSAHISAQYGGIVSLVNSYTIAGSATYHWLVADGGLILSGTAITVTVSGTPAFTTFAYGQETATIRCPNITFAGSATGTRYVSNLNSLIQTNGGGATYLPGSVSGTTATGGLYA